MKKFLTAFSILSLIILSGCATNPFKDIGTVFSAAQNLTITQGQVDSARNTYDGFVLAPLRKYALLPRCKTGQTLTLNNPCHDRKLLKQIREVDKQVEIAFANTQRRVTSGDNQGAVSAYNTLMDAIGVAKALINQTGVAALGA